MKGYIWGDVNDPYYVGPDCDPRGVFKSKAEAKKDFKAYASEFLVNDSWKPKLVLYKITFEEIE